METTYTATAHKATIITPRLHFSGIHDLAQYIQRYKPATDGSYIYHPETLGECDVNVELDGGLLFSVGIRRKSDTTDALIVEAIDIETRKAVDLSYDAEAQDFITYLEKLRD